MADDFVILVSDTANTGKKVDNSSLTVGANTVYRMRTNIADPTVATGLATVGATNAALSETTLSALRTASSLFAFDSGASAGSQQVPLAVVTGTSLLKVGVLNSTNQLPAGDAAARSIFTQIADGTTGPAAVMAASTAAAATDKALVVALSPNNTAAGTVVAGTVAAKSWLGGVQWLNYASTPALTTAQGCAIQGDSNGVLKTAAMPAGTPVYAGSGSVSASAATATLTQVAAKMMYLDGIDVDGLGATAGAAVNLTIVGVLGGTLTIPFGVPAGATVPVRASYRFNPPLQASAINTSLVVSAASFGSGNTAAAVTAYGHYV